VAKKRRGSMFFYLLASGLLLWSAHHFFAQNQLLEHISSYIMYPILVAQNKIIIPIKEYFAAKRSRQEMEQMLHALQAEKADLLAQNVQLNAMISYNSQIKELVQFKKQFENIDAIVSQVLVKHFSDQSHYFLIDKGANAGIVPDMVALYKNCLLGKVTQVYPKYSKVLLITDAMCKVAAYCVHTQASGIHEGNNNEMITGMRYVSHLAEVEPDDLVLSSGDGLIFPKGFALGKIKECNPAGLFYDVTVEPLIDLRKIDYCFVIQKGAVIDDAVMSQTLIALCEEHEKKVDDQQKIKEVIYDERVESIELVGQLEQVVTITYHENANYIPEAELVQQQRLAAQVENETIHHKPEFEVDCLKTIIL